MTVHNESYDLELKADEIPAVVKSMALDTLIQYCSLEFTLAEAVRRDELLWNLTKEVPENEAVFAASTVVPMEKA